MTRDRQFDRFISSLQGIDAALASLIITDPLIYPNSLRSLQTATGFSWHVDDGPKVIHVHSLVQAFIRDGMILIRNLSNVLGIKATFKSPRLDVVKSSPVAEGNDLHWSHITGAKGISTSDVDLFALGDFGIEVENGRVIPFNEAYLGVLKAADKSIAHFTHENEWSAPYNGAVFIVGVFLVATTQLAILKPSWGDTYDEIVFRNSKRMLPKSHFDQYMLTYAEIKTGVLGMLNAQGITPYS